MQRTLESYSVHTQMIEKFQNVFPNLNISSINHGNSIFASLNDIIKRIPKPNIHQTSQIISSMKNYVDGQQLRIQMNMIQIEQAQPVPLNCINKKYSMQTREDQLSLDDRSLENVQDWGWESKGLVYQESLNHQFSSYID